MLAPTVMARRAAFRAIGFVEKPRRFGHGGDLAMIRSRHERGSASGIARRGQGGDDAGAQWQRFGVDDAVIRDMRLQFRPPLPGPAGKAEKRQWFARGQ